MSSIRTARLAALAGVVIAAAAPAVAAAAPAKKTVRYAVKVKPGALAQGRTVNAKAVVTNPESSVSDWWSRSTVSKVVRKGVNNGYERPFRAQGYRCTPTVKGNTASFVCKLRGGDVATTIRLTFRAAYAG